MFFYLLAVTVQTFVVFVWTFVYHRLLALERSLVEDDVVEKEVSEVFRGYGLAEGIILRIQLVDALGVQLMVA